MKLTVKAILDAMKLRAKVIWRTVAWWAGLGGGLYVGRYLWPSDPLFQGETFLWDFILVVAFSLTYRTEMLKEKLALRQPPSE
jgi:hypothetical protein